MKLTFWGAARTTTGSMHIVENEGRRVALDCGMFQGRRADFYRLNSDFPMDPATIHSLVLSHAHIDHIGNVPKFAAEGFKGDIFATHPTVDLARTMLLDSAYIQQKETEFVNKRHARRGDMPVHPLYTVEQAEACLPQLVGVGYYRFFTAAEGMRCKYLEAGHILGSAQVEMDIERKNGGTTRLVFSGDIGRGESALLRPPEIPSDTDILIMECTYGNRDSPPAKDLRNELKEIVARVAARHGKVIIPAFSVGRTQDIVFQLNQLFNEGALPRIPIWVDSPLSANVTEIFRNHPECFNREVRDTLMKDDDVFGFETLRYTRNVEESKALNDVTEPCVIISASGMCENGRILHHLSNSVENANNLILIVGYQAENTLGRKIVERQSRLRIFGEEHQLRAEVKVLNGFSGHADASELRDYAFRVQARSAGRLKKVFLVHGEIEPAEALAEYLRNSLELEVEIPERGQVFEV